VPFSWTKIVNAAFPVVNPVNGFDDQDFNFRGLNNIENSCGAWHDNLTIGHYGVKTLRPDKDI